MATFALSVTSQLVTLTTSKELTEESMPAILEALAADPVLGFVEATTLVDQTETVDGEEITIQVPVTTRNPATPEQIATALGDKFLALLLEMVNNYHRQKAAMLAEQAYQPITPST